MNDVSETKLYRLEADWLDAALGALERDGVEVLAPVKDEDGSVNLAPVTASSEVATDYLNALIPLKSVFMPRTEVLIEYERAGVGDVEVLPGAAPAGQRVVLGCRPCDARALVMLDSVFNWDYEDVPYRARRDSTTVVSWACMDPGPHCFCTSVGGSPHSAEGSDAVVYLAGSGPALLQVVTAKGAAFVESLGDRAQPAADGTALPEPPELETKFDTGEIKTWLDENFESELWEEVSLRCLGCGACSFLCPTCHCFDIVDESTWKHGERRRNWDSCAFCQFTQHASGHNPRPNQTTRCRQRVMHKFKYFPDRFEQVACVGCGRCAQNCGVGQNLVSILSRIQSEEKP
ncbi:MAG: hypothetical protein GWP08_07800 [Nitrospiraceae bacterium]|nr:hypothetical protein [Nitrospiraceae bacterium]